MKQNRCASPGFTNAICKYNGRSAASLTSAPACLLKISLEDGNRKALLGRSVGRTKARNSWPNLPNLNIHARFELDTV